MARQVGLAAGSPLCGIRNLKGHSGSSESLGQVEVRQTAWDLGPADLGGTSGSTSAALALSLRKSPSASLVSRQSTPEAEAELRRGGRRPSTPEAEALDLAHRSSSKEVGWTQLLSQAELAHTDAALQRTHVASIRAEAAQLRAEVEAARKLAASRKSHLSEAEAAQLRAEVEAARMLAASRKSHLSEAEAEVEKVREWAMAAEKEASNQRSAASTAKAGAVECHALVEAAQAVAAQLQSELNAAENEPAARCPKLASSEREVVSLKLQVQAAQMDALKPRSQIQILEAEVVEQRRELEVAEMDIVLQRSRAVAECEQASFASRAKSVQGTEETTAKNKARSDRQLNECELRSNEAQAELSQRLQHAEARCRELEGEVVQHRDVSSREALGSSSEIQELSSSVSRQHAEFSRILTSQTSSLELRLTKQVDDFQSLKVDSEQQLRSGQEINKELRLELAQQQSLAASDAAHEANQMSELKSLLADQKQATQEAIARAAAEREHSQTMAESRASEFQLELSQERLSIQQVVENVHGSISKLFSQAANQQSGLLGALSSTFAALSPAMSPRRPNEWTAAHQGSEVRNQSRQLSRAPSSVDAGSKGSPSKGLPSELSMLSDILDETQQPVGAIVDADSANRWGSSSRAPALRGFEPLNQQPVGAGAASGAQLKRSLTSQELQAQRAVSEIQARMDQLVSEVRERSNQVNDALAASNQRLAASEALAQEMEAQSDETHQLLEVAASQAATFSEQLESSQAARQTLQIQLAEVRELAASEALCLQEESRRVQDETAKSESRAGQLEAKIETLQERELALQKSKCDLELQHEEKEAQHKEEGEKLEAFFSSCQTDRIPESSLTKGRNTTRSITTQKGQQASHIGLSWTALSEKLEAASQRLEAQHKAELSEVRLQTSSELETMKQDRDATHFNLVRAEADAGQVQSLQKRAAEELDAAKRDLVAQLASQRETEAAQSHCHRRESDEMEAAMRELTAKHVSTCNTESAQLRLQKTENDGLESVIQDLEVRLATQGKAEAAKQQQLRREVTDLAANEQEVEAEFASQRSADSKKFQRQRKEADELKAEFEELEDQLASQRKVEAAQERKAEAALQFQKRYAEELVAAQLELETQLADQREAKVAQLQDHRNEVDELAVQLASQRSEQAARLDFQGRETNELEAAAQGLEERLAAHAKGEAAQILRAEREADQLLGAKHEFEVELASQHKLTTAETAAAQEAVLRGRGELAEFKQTEEETFRILRSESEEDWQASQARIRKLEDKLSQLRSATSMSVYAAKRLVQEIDEESIVSKHNSFETNGAESKMYCASERSQ